MPVFELSAKVIDRASYGLGLAPKRISGAIMRRFYIERNKFVGKRKKSTGTFTRSVLARSRRGREGRLPIAVAGMFRGEVKGQLGAGKSMNILSLRMGILKSNPTAFMRGIIELQEGFSHSASGFMPVPIYKNLAKLGINFNFFKRFKEMMSAGELETIRIGGQVLFVSKKLKEGGDIYDAAMFVGTRRINVRPMNFRFIDKWKAAWPGFQKRLGNAIEREIRAVEKGYAEAK